MYSIQVKKDVGLYIFNDGDIVTVYSHTRKELDVGEVITICDAVSKINHYSLYTSVDPDSTIIWDKISNILIGKACRYIKENDFDIFKFYNYVWNVSQYQSVNFPEGAM